MSLGALAESPVYTSLWDLKDEVEMGHIQLSPRRRPVLVCPATADLLAKMAAGIADDLATTLLLATDKPVVVAPAMNVRMWQHAATAAQRRATARPTASPSSSPTRATWPAANMGRGGCPSRRTILDESFRRERSRAASMRSSQANALAGKHILVTAGPTHEPIDPVRVIANRSSGKQGFAIAAAAAEAGARVTLIAGPVALATPGGVARIDVETAEQMAAGGRGGAARRRRDPGRRGRRLAGRAVADQAQESDGPPHARLRAQPRHPRRRSASIPTRPRLLIGFAAETDDVVANAAAKRDAKGADWIVANDVSGDVMGGAHNRVHLVTAEGVEDWPEASKEEVARRLIEPDRAGAR